mmetsp:Transcript_12881/g.16884  ORF Transcript_12881/g.16884 Transcript_12881/m.16884 type:complete len:183 (+) Transcript_12881:179-727(+)
MMLHRTTRTTTTSVFAKTTSAATLLICLLWLTIESTGAFTVNPATTTTTTRKCFSSTVVVFGVTADDGESDKNENDETIPSLILDNETIQQQMQQVKSKYPTNESDYLAAARARAAAKTPSVTRKATDDEWQRIAKEKQLTKEALDLQDDWEDSLKEAGNADSQILIPMNEPGEDEEPTLLL